MNRLIVAFTQYQIYQVSERITKTTRVSVTYTMNEELYFSLPNKFSKRVDIILLCFFLSVSSFLLKHLTVLNSNVYLIAPTSIPIFFKSESHKYGCFRTLFYKIKERTLFYKIKESIPYRIHLQWLANSKSLANSI